MSRKSGGPPEFFGVREKGECAGEKMRIELEKLIYPERVYSRSEFLASDSKDLKGAGAYSWFFKEIPPLVPVSNCVRHGETTLLYVGISPKRSSQSGRGSSETLRSRMRYHYLGNAYGSTLRCSLGCLLSDRLGIRLRRIGTGRRATFGDGEESLSRWMEQNASVAWVRSERPWENEAEALTHVSLPLNLQGNERHAFHPILSSLRAKARREASAVRNTPSTIE